MNRVIHVVEFFHNHRFEGEDRDQYAGIAGSCVATQSIASSFQNCSRLVLVKSEQS